MDTERTAARVWRETKRFLTPLMVSRIKRHVINEGWTLTKALADEGVLFAGTPGQGERIERFLRSG